MYDDIWDKEFSSFAFIYNYTKHLCLILDMKFSHSFLDGIGQSNKSYNATIKILSVIRTQISSRLNFRNGLTKQNKTKQRTLLNIPGFWICDISYFYK